MAFMHTAKLLKPIMASITSPYSSLSHSRIQFYGKFQPLKTWMKGLQPPMHNHCPSSHWNLFVQRYHHMHNLYKPGCKFSMRSMFGVPVVFGLISFLPGIAYSMDGIDILVDDHQLDLFGVSDSKEDPRTILTFARKLWLPVFLFLTVLMNWGHPIILAAKVILMLLSTKPSPFSVYLFVEQLRHQFMRQHPFYYKFKSLYAKKVEVEDYIFLCLARVELKDQKFTLIGILGSWWVLPLSPCQGAFSLLRNGALKNYIRS